MSLFEPRLVRASSEGGYALPELPKALRMQRSRTACQISFKKLYRPFGSTCNINDQADKATQLDEACPPSGWVLVESDRLLGSVASEDLDACLISSSAQEPAEGTTTPVDPHVVHQLDLDLPRTHPRNPIVKARLAAIRSMLLRQAAVDPELGYCQGMNLVAASFAFAYRNEDDAYQRFHHLVHRVRGLWLQGFPLLEKGTWHFELLAKQRPWFQHLLDQRICPLAYLPQQWLTLFATWLPLPTLDMCIELFECEGFAGILAMSLAIFDHVGSTLQAMKHEDLLVSFGPRGLIRLRRQLPEASVLAKTVGAWLPLTCAEMDRPANTRIDTNLLQAQLEDQDSHVASPDGTSKIDLAPFFGSLADFADEVKERASDGRLKEGATDFALKAVVAGAETGRALFKTLLRRKNTKQEELA